MPGKGRGVPFESLNKTTHKVTVTGAVKEKDGKKTLTASKIELVKE